MPTALLLQLRSVDWVGIGLAGGDFQEVSLRLKVHHKSDGRAEVQNYILHLSNTISGEESRKALIDAERSHQSSHYFSLGESEPA